MAKVVRGVDDYKKEFLRLFDSLCGKYSRWEVWSDFIQLTAIDMSNATDKVNAPKRMETGKTIRKKYRDADMETMGNMLMQLVYGMDADTDQDFLGELYMACNLGNDHAGQFFTPYNVCQCMSEITYDVPALLDGKGFIAVNDPACGAGALLLSFANICKRKGINYQEKVLFIAQDIDYIVGLMCYIHNMAVHAALWGDGGIPHTLPAAALVVYGLVGLVGRAHKAGAYRAVVVGNDLCGCLTGDACEFDFNAEVLVLDGNHCGGLP